jgi:hypothetical protein
MAAEKLREHHGCLKRLLASVPPRKDQAFIPLRIILGSAVLSAALVIGWIELFWRHCL